MSPEKIDAMLAKIDAAVGRPEDESPEDRAARAERAEKRIRRKAVGAPL